MPETDYFGYISLAKHSTNDQVQLERKGRNTKTKAQFLDAIAEAELELDIGKAVKSRQDKLADALQQALDWQNNLVADEQIEQN